MPKPSLPSKNAREPRHGGRVVKGAIHVCALVLCCMGAVQAAVVSLPASRDNTLYEDAVGGLSNGAGEYFFAGNNGGGSLRRAVLQFGLGAIPPGVIVTEATLTLYVSRTISEAIPHTIHRLSRDWGEGTSDAGERSGGGAIATAGGATWHHTSYPDTFWSSPGGDFLSVASAQQAVNGPGFYTWGPSGGLTADVQNWLDNSGGNFGWIILSDESSGATAKRFNSRSHLTTATRPVLRVTYAHPVPILSSLLVSNRFVLRFSTEPGRSDTVESRDSLASTAWQTATNLPPATGVTQVIFSRPLAPGSRFYRVIRR